MANIDNPHGFAAVKHMAGGLVRHSDGYVIASALGSNIFTGDPVKSTGTGRNITVAAAGNTVRGVFDGCQYVDAQGDVQFRPYWASGTVTMGSADAEAFVYDDPNIVFSVQCNAALAAADIANKADFTMATAGNTSTGISGAELDISSLGQDGLLILQLDPDPQNAFGADADAWVLLREHELRGVLTAV